MKISNIALSLLSRNAVREIRSEEYVEHIAASEGKATVGVSTHRNKIECTPKQGSVFKRFEQSNPNFGLPPSPLRLTVTN